MSNIQTCIVIELRDPIAFKDWKPLIVHVDVIEHRDPFQANYKKVAKQN